MALVVHCIGLHILMIALCIGHVYFPKYSNMKWKSFWLMFTFGAICAGIFFAVAQIYTVANNDHVYLVNNYYKLKHSAAARMSDTAKSIQDVWWVITIMVAGFIRYINLKKLDKAYADKPNINNVIVLFRYPNNAISLVLLIFGFPFNSVSVYHKGYQYTFLKGEDELIKREMAIESLSDELYFMKNTGFIDKCAELDKLIGTKKRVVHNCLNVFAPVIGRIGNHVRTIW